MLKTITILLFISFSITLTKSDNLTKDCLKPCPRIYDPVCAYDGVKHKTFSNSCVMENENCEKGTHFTIAQFGECIESNDDNIKRSSECAKICPLIYFPVCGSDGITYGNMCDFEIRNCEANYSLHVLKQGEC